MVIMKKEHASRIIEVVMSMEAPVVELISIVGSMPEGDEKKALTRSIGDIMNVMTCDFIFKIAKEFPELDPDKDAEWRKK